MRSIRLRLVIMSLVVISMALAGIWLVLGEIFERRLASEMSRQLSGTIDYLAARLTIDEAGPALESEPGDPRFELPAGGRYWQVEFVDRKVLRSRSLWDVMIDLDAARPIGNGRLAAVDGPDGAPLLILHEDVSLDLDGGIQEVYLTAAMDRAEYDAAIAEFGRELMLMLAIAGVLLLVGSQLQLILGLSPLRVLERSIRSVEEGRTARVSEDGPLEMQPLVRGLNSLLDTRQEDIEKARNRASDLAHGIKTPLTVLAQYAENLSDLSRDEEARLLSAQIQAIRDRVERQLVLTRMATGSNAFVEVKPHVGKLVGVVSALPGAGKLRWQVDIMDGLKAPLEEADLAEALGNILDNARKWARSVVRISAERKPDGIRLAVEDDGDGIGPETSLEAMNRILGRGVKLDELRGETGLGLAISREITEAYHGTIAVSRSALGGLCITLEFPLGRARGLFAPGE